MDHSSLAASGALWDSSDLSADQVSDGFGMYGSMQTDRAPFAGDLVRTCSTDKQDVYQALTGALDKRNDFQYHPWSLATGADLNQLTGNVPEHNAAWCHRCGNGRVPYGNKYLTIAETQHSSHLLDSINGNFPGSDTYTQWSSSSLPCSQTNSNSQTHLMQSSISTPSKASEQALTDIPDLGQAPGLLPPAKHDFLGQGVSDTPISLDWYGPSSNVGLGLADWGLADLDPYPGAKQGHYSSAPSTNDSESFSDWTPAEVLDQLTQRSNPVPGINLTAHSRKSRHTMPQTIARGRERRFPCPRSSCRRAFTSKNDLDRHLATRKHRKDRENSSDNAYQYVCPIPYCKRSKEGFSGKDHFLHHMDRIHDMKD